MDCAACYPCAGCGHPRARHLDHLSYPCLVTVYRYVAGNSGPGYSMPRPCPCPGYIPREVTMMPEPAGTPAPAPAAAAAAEVHQVLHDLAAAWEQSHQALMNAHQAWIDAARDNHSHWVAQLEQLSARLAAAAGGPAGGGQL